MKQETVDLYGSSKFDLENKLHEFLDDPRILYRDARYSRDEDGGYCATVLYEYRHRKELKELGVIQ